MTIYDIFQKKNENLPKTIRQKANILVDYREKNSLVPSFLKKYSLNFIIQELKVGDYQIQDTIIERKEAKDFTQSIKNKRIWKQMQEMKQFPNYLLIIEGDPYQTNLHKNAIRGAIISISINYKIPIIQTKNAEETATIINLISRKEIKKFSLNPKKKNKSQIEQIQFALESFPGIGPKTTKKLLLKFKTLKNIFNANETELGYLIGKKATKFLNILNYKFN